MIVNNFHLFEKLGPVFTWKSNTHPGQYILTKGKNKNTIITIFEKGGVAA